METLYRILKILIALLALTCTACAEEYVITASAPSGAPALALATIAVENPDRFTFVAAETISAEFANQNSDFIIAPLNAGAKLYKAGKSTYKLAGVVSWGNLYIASQKEGFTVEDIRRISGRIRLPSNEAIQNLFRMTPYYYKTGADDQRKINNIDCLETGAEFEIRIYRKD